MILTKEDYGILTQIQVLLAKVLKNAVMSEIEEAHERNFEKQLNSELKNERAFEIILLKRRKQTAYEVQRNFLLKSGLKTIPDKSRTAFTRYGAVLTRKKLPVPETALKPRRRISLNR